MDQYRENLIRIVEGKVKGKAVALKSDARPRQADVVDLMKRLQRSLEQGGGGKSRAVKPRTQKTRRVSKRRTSHAA